MIRTFKLRTRFMAALAVCALAASGCGDVIDGLTGGYRGPLPAREGLSGETVIVRSISAGADSHRLVLDRVRYLDAGDPHDVNRVILAYSMDLFAQVQALNPQPGDRLVVSTTFFQMGETGDLGEVPDWPGHDHVEFPIGAHHVTAIARES